MNCRSLIIFIQSLFLLCTSLVSAQDYGVGDPFETMIRLGSMQVENALYTMPAGNAGNMYITSATTSGKGVEYPLNYRVSVSPVKYFVIVSKVTALLTRGKKFDLKISQKNFEKGTIVNAYFDWNRDGIFEASLPLSVSKDEQHITQCIAVPKDAVVGKTRIRVRYDSFSPASSESPVSNGRVYDFVVYVLKK